jgi:transcription elongation factor GreA
VEIIYEGERVMSEEKKLMMTHEGIQKLEDELEYLRTVKRNEIKEKIKVARSFGDLSENAEYDEAKNEQAFAEGRIAQIENMLRHAEVVDESELNDDIVNIGSKVRVKDYEFDEEVEFKIVGSAEAEPMEYKISNESPVGNGLMGKKVGDIIVVEIPSGTSKYEILEVRRS